MGVVRSFGLALVGILLILGYSSASQASEQDGLQLAEEGNEVCYLILMHISFLESCRFDIGIII